MKPQFDITIILCFLICIWISFCVGCGVGSRSTKSNIQERAITEGRGVIEEGEFKWIIKGDEE